jgi:hypothetical protein
MAEKHQRHLEMWMSQDVLFAIQSILMIIGFIMSVQIIKHRASALNDGKNISRSSLFPTLFFVIAMTSFHLWMLMQAMIMRM